MDTTILLNVCILPTEEVAKHCTEISQTFDDAAVQFKLGNGLFPHSTIYMARFNNTSVGAAKSALEKLVTQLTPALMQHAGYFLTEGGYAEVLYSKTKELVEFQKQIIENLKDLRGLPSEAPKESYYGPYTEAQQENVRQTGYDLAYDLYRPHITLTRYKDNAVPVSLPVLPEIDLSFTPQMIALYEADENGAIFKEIAKFRLG